MASFGKLSMSRLITVHSDLQILFRHVVIHYDCTILCGKRGRDVQNLAFQDGRSKVKWPNSNHNVADTDGNETYGLSRAIDVAPWFATNPRVRWNDRRSWDHFTGFVKGIAASLKIMVISGNDWDSDHDLTDQGFIDAPHWELLRRD